MPLCSHRSNLETQGCLRVSLPWPSPVKHVGAPRGHLSSPSRPCEGPHSQVGKLRRGGYPTFKATRWAGSRPSCPAPLVLPGSAVPGTQDSPGQPGSPVAQFPACTSARAGLCVPGSLHPGYVLCALCLAAPGVHGGTGPAPPCWAPAPGCAGCTRQARRASDAASVRQPWRPPPNTSMCVNQRYFQMTSSFVPLSAHRVPMGLLAGGFAEL